MQCNTFVVVVIVVVVVVVVAVVVVVVVVVVFVVSTRPESNRVIFCRSSIIQLYAGH